MFHLFKSVHGGGVENATNINIEHRLPITRHARSEIHSSFKTCNWKSMEKMSPKIR